jgi:hypothetical protein
MKHNLAPSSFKVMSQRLNNDNILVEQGCAGIKK